MKRGGRPMRGIWKQQGLRCCYAARGRGSQATGQDCTAALGAVLLEGPD